MNISLKILNIFKFRSQLVLTFAFSLFTFSSSFSAPQIYLIDPSGSGDYKSITEAIDDLYSSLPISNEIIYKIASGNYEEQLIFNGPITGGNATNTITFASAADDSTQVNIGTNAGNVIEIDNAQFITFSKLTFTAPSNARIINSTNCEGYLTFTNNIFNGVSSGNDDIINLISGNGQSLDNINISGNIFNNGNDGINLTSVNIGQNLDIANNIFSTKNRAIVCTNFNSPDILSNTITNNSNDFALWLIGNTNYSIAKNKINTTTDLGSGIYINNPNSGTTYDNGTIVNNFIQASNIGLSLDELVSVDIFFNTINIENFPLSTKSTSYAVYSTSADLDIKNNIFHNNRNGKSFRFQNDPSNQNDYNVLFTNGITLGEYSTTPITSLSDLHSESGMDFNSKQAEILFNSLSNLHLSGISQTIYGTQITSITTDIDGESRNNPPIIGADEYKPNPITNDKLIGASGDYNTIKEAMCDLYLNGIDNAVTFYILDGSYIDQINFSENIPGSSASNIFTLQSESNNPKNVEINYTASDSLRNFVIKINEAQYIKIKNLTLTADGTSFAKVVWLENDCNNLEFYGNIFNGYEITNGLASEEQNVFSCIDSSVLINTAILNNEFNNGSSGIMLLLNNNTKPHGIVINNNIIQDNYSGVNIYNADSPIISYNTISNNQYSYILSLYECIDTLTIESNKINGKNGVNISQCNGTDLLRGKINNNFITPNLYIMNSSFIEINHNSIQSFGASYSNSRVFELDYKNIYTGTLENLNIYNNIFNNIQDGYAYYTDGGSNISSNYNNLFTTGEYIGFADGADTPLLTDFRNASGTDANSYMATVNFFSNADLHIVSTSESIMGVAVSGITKDIDGNTRNDPPFIGADEFKRYPGYVNLYTQAEVDSFGALGYSSVTGEFAIRNSTDITDLTPLNTLVSVGSLNLNNNSVLTNLDGLSGLRSIIYGNCNIGFSPTLLNLNGLSNLTSIEGNISLNTNASLANIDGLDNISTVGGDLYIFNVDQITNLSGLSNVATIGGNLKISSCDGLIDLNGLNANLTEIGGNLEIEGNTNLINLSGLNNIISVGNNLKISFNPALTNIDALNNLTSVGYNFDIENNSILQDLNGLSRLTSIGNYLRVYGNFQLNNFCGLDALITPGNPGVGFGGFYYVGLNSYNPTLDELESGNCSDLRISINIIIYLEGPYREEYNNMSIDLSLPSISPYDGSEATTLPGSATDWILVELRNKNDATNILESQSAFLLQDGRIVNSQDGGSIHTSLPADEYYISIKHRNHLPIMSANPILVN